MYMDHESEDSVRSEITGARKPPMSTVAIQKEKKAEVVSIR